MSDGLDHRDGAVAILRLARPKVGNALDMDLARAPMHAARRL